jgi:uncharacterized membrane protein
MSQPNTSDHHAGIFIALVPWVLFSVVCRISVDAASLLALAASAVIAAPGIKAGRPKILELAAVVSFAGFAAVVLAIDPGAADTLHRYARAIAAGLLAVIAFGSLLFTPFTEQYARESLPERVWNTAKFKAGNRAMTAMWGAVFAAMVPCHIIAGSLDTQRANLIFNWVVPSLLVMWAVKRSSVPAEAAATPTHA